MSLCLLHLPPAKKLPTIEMCMRELDREKAAQYYKDRDDGRTMIDKSGI